jgi:signal transduction histidine kinase
MKSFSAPKAAFLTITVLLLLGSQSVYCAQRKNTEIKRILVMFSYHEGLPWETRIEENLYTTLASTPDLNIELNIEHTDLVRHHEKGYLKKLEDLYRHKYSNPKMDLIIGFDDEAVGMLLDYDEKLFPEIPMVLITAEHKTLQRDILKPNMTSLLWGADIRANVELIGEILPQTRYIFVVAGTSASDREVLKLAQASLGENTKRFAILYLTDISARDLIKKVTQLPKHSALLYLSFSRDTEGKSFIPREILSILSKQANIPVFGIVDTYLGHGIVGGNLLSAEEQGKRCAEIALRILRGESPEDMIPKRMLNQLMFDWRQLKHWGISEDKLPAGSIVRYKEFSIWDKYRWHIIGILSFSLLEFLLIIGLLTQGKRRYRAELTMKKSEAKFASIFKSIPLPVFLLDKDGHILEFSHAAHEFATSSIREMKGLGFGNAFSCVNSLNNSQGCGFCASSEDCTVHRVVSNTFLTGQLHRQVEAKFTVDDGQNRHDKYLLVSTVPLDLTEERQVLLYIEDITERRDTELELHKHRIQLAHMARRASIGEVTASLAHELNQPLTAILSSAQAAQRFLISNPPNLNRVQSILSHIVKDVMRASDLILRLRALLSKGELQIQSQDINEIIREIVTTMKSYAATENVLIEVDLSTDLPSVWGDKIHIEQVIMNLILNGTEAMIASEHIRKLIISTKEYDVQNVSVSVRDYGMGFDPENIDRIFEPFYTNKPGGLGIGLSVVRSIIDAHGGRLWAENNPGRGATFYFTVPTIRQKG